MIPKKIIRKLIDAKDDVCNKFEKLKALSKFDFSRVLEFAIKEVLEANKSGREPNVDNVAKFAPDLDASTLEEFITFSKAVVSCWEKIGNKPNEIINCIKEQ